MNCQGFCDGLHAYMAGGLTPPVRVELESHARACERCRALEAVAREITCREVADFLDDYEGGALDVDRRAVFERHLAICDECRNYLASYRVTIELGRAAFAARADEPATEVPQELVRAILMSLGASRGREP